MKLKVILIITPLLCLGVLKAAVAQYVREDLPAEAPYKQTLLDKWVFGGNVAVNFGSTYSVVDVSPSALYKFTDRLMAGPGINYLYRSVIGQQLSPHTYGGRLQGRFVVYQNFFLAAEYQLLNTEVYSSYPFTDLRERIWFHNPMAGGGIAYNIGGLTASLSVMYLFNGNQQNNPYGYLRVGNQFVIQCGMGF